MAAAAGTGCLDFVAPELPERGAAAVAQITVVRTDSATLTVTGTVAPGLDGDGLRRIVTDAAIEVDGHRIEPTDTTDAGSLVYQRTLGVPAGTPASIEIRAPRIAGTSGAPTVRWPTARRTDDDSVSLEADGSIRLRVAESGEPAVPEPEGRQWFLTLTGAENNFRLGSDGVPPAELDVPARWVPADALGARLIYQQTTTLGTATEYVALITLDLRMHWVVRP